MADETINKIKEDIKKEAIDELKEKEKNYLIKLSDIPIEGVPIRLIDIAKFNQYFGVPWENVMNDLEYIKNKIGYWLYFGFWAWRGWNFVNKKKPTEELTFSEYASMFKMSEALDMFNLFYPKQSGTLRETKDELSKD